MREMNEAARFAPLMLGRKRLVVAASRRARMEEQRSSSRGCAANADKAAVADAFSV